MKRYLFNISGHMEVDARTLEEAQAKIKDKTITHFDKDSGVFVLVTASVKQPFHVE